MFSFSHTHLVGEESYGLFPAFISHAQSPAYKTHRQGQLGLFCECPRPSSAHPLPLPLLLFSLVFFPPASCIVLNKAVFLEVCFLSVRVVAGAGAYFVMPAPACSRVCPECKQFCFLFFRLCFLRLFHHRCDLFFPRQQSLNFFKGSIVSNKFYFRVLFYAFKQPIVRRLIHSHCPFAEICFALPQLFIIPKFFFRVFDNISREYLQFMRIHKTDGNLLRFPACRAFAKIHSVFSATANRTSYSWQTQRVLG